MVGEERNKEQGARSKDNGEWKIGNGKWGGILIFVAALFLLNMLGNYQYFRIDFTKDKRFTLAKQTKTILQKNDKEIKITVFLDGDMPSAFKRLKNATQDLLADFKAYSKASIKITFVDPIAGLGQSEQDTVIKNLINIGIKPTNIKIKNDAGFTEKLVFPMALVESDGKQMPVKLLQNLGGAAGDYEESINNSIQNLAYTFTSSIKKVITGYNPRIGFTEGNGEPSNLYLYDAISSLADSYVVGRVNLDVISKEALDSMKVLVIAKPLKPFTEAQKYKINYFVMKGGAVIWAIDQVRMELDSLRNGNSRLATNQQLNLDDMLFEYGARINYNLIADANCAQIPIAAGQQGIQLTSWPYYPVLLPDTSCAVVKNIDNISSKFASTVDTIGTPNVKKTAIVQTSPYNIVFNTPKLFSLQMVAQQLDPKQFSGKLKDVGVLLEGSFKSVFLNRPIPTGITENFEVPNQSLPTKMVVLGDGDIFENQVNGTDGSPYPLGFDRYTQQNFGNKALLLNLVDYFTNTDNLIELRNKELKIRLLDKTLIRQEKTKWQLINIFGPIALLICFAIFQHYYRRYKYAK